MPLIPAGTPEAGQKLIPRQPFRRRFVIMIPGLPMTSGEGYARITIRVVRMPAGLDIFWPYFSKSLLSPLPIRG